jgi:hypothetical protein
MDTIEELPNVIQNSDYLYKSDIKWNNDIEYIEPNEYEKDMLKNTKSPKELIEEELDDDALHLSQEEKIKNLILMFQVIALNRMNIHPLFNVSNLQLYQKKELLGHMKSLKADYDNDLFVDITNEFNKICNDKLFGNNTDVSSYPVYNRV